MTILYEEMLQWIDVDDGLPDDEQTVVVFAPAADDPVWLGYHEGGSWYAVGGEEYGNEEELSASVTAWAILPMGPKR